MKYSLLQLMSLVCQMFLNHNLTFMTDMAQRTSAAYRVKTAVDCTKTAGGEGAHYT